MQGGGVGSAGRGALLVTPGTEGCDRGQAHLVLAQLLPVHVTQDLV